MSFYLNARLALYMEIGQQMLLNGVNFELLMTSRSSVIEWGRLMFVSIASVCETSQIRGGLDVFIRM